MSDKISTYEELPCLTWGMELSKLEDLIARARKAGHNTFDIDVDICPYYRGVDGATIRTSYSAVVDAVAREPK